jgi:hypothetical protein
MGTVHARSLDVSAKLYREVKPTKLEVWSESSRGAGGRPSAPRPADGGTLYARKRAFEVEGNTLMVREVLRPTANLVAPPSPLDERHPVIVGEQAQPGYAQLLKGDTTPIYPFEFDGITTWVGSYLPHNAESFARVYGSEEGAELWSLFQARFAQVRGRPFTVADETHF